MNTTAIIIQGSSTNVVDQKKAWKEYLGNCIFSTWVGEEMYYEEGDTVLFNENPQDPGPMNFNCQTESTLVGLRYAQEKGYSRALKIRSDLVPTNAENFLKLIDNNCFNFLAWQNHEVHPGCTGYLVDYLMSGLVEDMLTLWTIGNNVSPVPEVKLTVNYIDNTSLFSNKQIEYFLDSLGLNVDLFWIKRNIHLSSLQPPYKLHGGFSNNKIYLNKDYTNFLKR